MSTPQQRGGLVLRALPPRLPVQSNLVAWFDATQIDGVSGGVVPQWLDASGNGNHVAQATGAAQPTLQGGRLNGLPVVEFSGAQSLLGADSGMPTGDVSLFLVSRTNLTGSSQVYFTFGTLTTAKSVTIYFDSGAKALAFTQQGDNIQIANSDNAYYIGSFTRSGSTYNMWRNGASNTSKSMTTTTTLYGANGLSLGGYYLGSAYLTGWIAEAIVYSTAISTADRQTMERYLSNKWGIAI